MDAGEVFGVFVIAEAEITFLEGVIPLCGKIIYLL